MTMVSISEALNYSNDRLSRAGIETARLDARLLIEHVLRLSPHEMISQKERPLKDALDHPSEFAPIISPKAG